MNQSSANVQRHLRPLSSHRNRAARFPWEERKRQSASALPSLHPILLRRLLRRRWNSAIMAGTRSFRREAALTRDTFDRRDVVKLMAAAGAAVPAARALLPGAAHAATPAYDPVGKFELDVKEVEFRRNTSGRMLMARIYQP